jgi:hypothetical protein
MTTNPIVYFFKVPGTGLGIGFDDHGRGATKLRANDGLRGAK